MQEVLDGVLRLCVRARLHWGEGGEPSIFESRGFSERPNSARSVARAKRSLCLSVAATRWRARLGVLQVQCTPSPGSIFGGGWVCSGGDLPSPRAQLNTAALCGETLGFFWREKLNYPVYMIGFKVG